MAKNEWAKTTQLIEAAKKILAEENPMTLRQLHYQLASVGVTENSDKDYRRASTTMTKARLDKRIPFDWMTDRSRPEYGGIGWDNLEEFAEQALVGYWRDAWQDQPSYCECWIEKDAISGSILPVADEYGIIIRTLRGFCSTTNVHKIAEQFQTLNELGKQIFVFYLGDHDPSGRVIETDIANRVKEHGSGPFSIKRLAIHKSDIARYKLLPLRVKRADTRSKAFIRKFGKECVEVDALKPSILRARLEAAIKSAIHDQAAWARAKRIEKAEKETTRRIQESLDDHVAGVIEEMEN
jgi:hypothetical protein